MRLTVPLRLVADGTNDCFSCGECKTNVSFVHL